MNESEQCPVHKKVDLVYFRSFFKYKMQLPDKKEEDIHVQQSISVNTLQYYSHFNQIMHQRDTLTLAKEICTCISRCFVRYQTNSTTLQ